MNGEMKGNKFNEDYNLDKVSENGESENAHPAISLNFEEIVEQNRKRIYYQMQRLGIRDPYGDFYAEGLHAMWMAYKKYEPDKGPLATYFNFMIRNRLIDKLRKDVRDQEKDEHIAEHKKQEMLEGSGWISPDALHENMSKQIEEQEFWREVKSHLTDKQWDWVYYYIIQDMSLKEIAELKGVSVEAVKSWGKGARKRLRTLGWERVSGWMRE